MISIKELRKNKKFITKRLALKQNDIDLDEVLMLDQKLRDLKTTSNDMRSERNTASESIGQLKKAGKDATIFINKTRELGDNLNQIERELDLVQIKLMRNVVYLVYIILLMPQQ